MGVRVSSLCNSNIPPPSNRSGRNSAASPRTAQAGAAERRTAPVLEGKSTPKRKASRAPETENPRPVMRRRYNRSPSPRRRCRGQRRSDWERSRSRDYRRRRRRSPSSESESDSSGTSGSDFDDKEGRIRVRQGDYIGTRDRYKVLGIAGKGTFGTVLNVIDTKYNDELAVKVVRSVKRYLEAALVEEDILRRIREKDPERKSLCVRLKGKFEIFFRGRKHVCLSFERLGKSLYEFMKSNDYRGFRMHHVKSFGYQLLKAVQFCHSIKLIHTDLKPENILLECSEYKHEKRGHRSDYRVPVRDQIRLIDFGGATFEYDHHSRIINTRQYRSPEVMLGKYLRENRVVVILNLGLGWSYPSDLWSIGCILAELRTGELLFKTHEDMEHLALMEKITGKAIPERMCLEADRLEADKHHSGSNRDTKRRRRKGRSSSNPRVQDWIEDGKLRWPENSSGKSSLNRVRKAQPLKEQFDDKGFVDLLERLLDHDPKKRITASQAMKHSFFTSLQR